MALSGKGRQINSAWLSRSFKRTYSKASLYATLVRHDIDETEKLFMTHYVFGVALVEPVETISFVESIGFQTSKIVSDLVSLTEGFVKQLVRSASDSVVLTEALAASKVVLKDVSDAVALTDTFVKRVDRTVGETVLFTEGLIKQLFRSTSDTVALTETEAIQTQKRNAEAVAMAEAIALQASKRLNESAGLTENLGAVVVPSGPSGTIGPVARMSISIGLRIG